MVIAKELSVQTVSLQHVEHVSQIQEASKVRIIFLIWSMAIPFSHGARKRSPPSPSQTSW